MSSLIWSGRDDFEPTFPGYDRARQYYAQRLSGGANPRSCYKPGFWLELQIKACLTRPSMGAAGSNLMYRKNKNPFCNEKRLGRSILVRKMASVKLKLHSFGSKNQLFGEGSSRNAIRKPSAALLFRTLPPDPRSRGSDQ